MLYHHGLDGDLKAAVIGTIDTLVADETGVWAEAQLDLRQRYVRAVQRLVDKGVLGWSSGSLPHLVEVAGDGQIKRWPIVEGSLTPAPAEPRRTDVHTIKSAYEALGLDMARLGIDQDDADKDTARRVPTVIRWRYETHARQDEKIIHIDEPPRKRLPLASAEDALKHIRWAARSTRWSAMDLLHGYMLLRSTKHFHGVSERYANALAHKVRKAGLSAIKCDELSLQHPGQLRRRMGPGPVERADLAARRGWKMPFCRCSRRWRCRRIPLNCQSKARTRRSTSCRKRCDEDQLSLGSGNAIPDSKVGSGKVQLAAKKLALRVGFSSELVEDAVIPVLNIYREQAVRAITDSIDYVLLNGDTASSGNINKNGGTPDSTDRYMAFNGLRKLPLVTTTANAVDAAGDPTLALLRQTRFTMAAKYAARPSDLAWIVDGGTYAKFLGMAEFLTMEKAGSLATAMTGQIGFADGAPVIVSAEMPLTDGADGKVSTTAEDNTKGTALCVYRPGWFVGYRRRIAVSVDYLPYYDAYQLTATVRLAFVNFDNDVAAALYNVTV